MSALTAVCLAASATIDRYPILCRDGAFIRRGEDSLAHGRRLQTVSDSREAERLDPANYHPRSQLGSIYSTFRDARPARAEYERAVRLNPDIKGNVGGALKPRNKAVN
jgi:Flp pilus assembly protein TadD